MKIIISETQYKLINESWYHGSPDARELELEGGFNERIMQVEYVKDIDGLLELQQQMTKARDEGNEKLYFKLLDKVGDYKEIFKYRKPVFLSDVYSVAKTYADARRAFDYQNALEKVYKVEVDCDKVVKINAPGDRFRFIDVNKVKKGFIDAGISEEDIDNVISMFNFYVTNNKGIKTDVIAAIGNWFNFDCIDVIGVLDSYHGGTTRSTVRMVLNPMNIKLIKI